MSSHRSSYPRFSQDESAYRCVQRMETDLSSRRFSYIPTNQIRQIYSYLKPGDIVAIATDIPGLDVTHTGLIYRNSNGGIGLIHAAPGSGVKLSPDLQTYMNQAENAIGIVVARSMKPGLRLTERTTTNLPNAAQGD